MRIFPEASGGFTDADKGQILLGRPFVWSMTPAESVVRCRVLFVPQIEVSTFVVPRISSQVITEPE